MFDFIGVRKFARAVRKLVNKSAILRRNGAILVGFFRIRGQLFKTLKVYNPQFTDLMGKVERPLRVLLAGSVGMNPDNLVQTLVGMGLGARGNLVDVMQCDGIMKACFNCKYHHFQSEGQQDSLIQTGPGLICKLCIAKGTRYARSANLNVLKYSSFLDVSDNHQVEEICQSLKSIEEIKSYKDNGIGVGEHAYSGAIRFFATPDLEDEEKSLGILKSYLFSSIVASRVFTNLFRQKHYDVVVLDHGIYVPQGVIVELANENGVPVVSFATGYRNKTFIFAKGGSYHHVIPKLKLEELPQYSMSQLDAAKEYITSRAGGKNDWVLFQEKSQSPISTLGLDDGNVNISLFTNVLWDAQIHFGDSLFHDSLDWLAETIKFVSTFDSVHLIIRIHPGEVKGFVKSRIGAEQRIRAMVGEEYLANVTIIPATSAVNSYELANACSFSIVDGSKIGIDLTAMGIPVVVAGDCWTKGKGISIDASTKAQYFNNIESGIQAKGFPAVNEINALTLAYYVYFDSMKELSFISKVQGDPPFAIDPNLSEESVATFKLLLENIEDV